LILPRGDFDPKRSGVDFLVEFDRNSAEALSLKAYFDFKEPLEALLCGPVDSVEPPESRTATMTSDATSIRELPH
jgi:predicted nucleotidyltransferase